MFPQLDDVHPQLLAGSSHPVDTVGYSVCPLFSLCRWLFLFDVGLAFVHQGFSEVGWLAQGQKGKQMFVDLLMQHFSVFAHLFLKQTVLHLMSQYGFLDLFQFLVQPFIGLVPLGHRLAGDPVLYLQSTELTLHHL